MAQPIVEPCSQGVIEAQPCSAEWGPAIAPRHRRAVLAAYILDSAMGFVDGPVLTVALSRLRADLGADRRLHHVGGYAVYFLFTLGGLNVSAFASSFQTERQM